MKYVIEAETDVARLALFDPGALPDDFDAAMARDPCELLTRLDGQGLLWHTTADHDGQHVLHAYVDEPVPPSIPFLGEPVACQRLAVPTGRLYFTGAECAFERDDARLSDRPSMGEMFEIAPGDYRTRRFHPQYPDNHLDGLLRDQVPLWKLCVHKTVDRLGLIAAAAIVFLLLAIFTVSWFVWLAILLPFTVMSVALPIALTYTRPYKEVSRLGHKLKRDNPDFIIELWRVDQA